MSCLDGKGGTVAPLAQILAPPRRLTKQTMVLGTAGTKREGGLGTAAPHSRCRSAGWGGGGGRVGVWVRLPHKPAKDQIWTCLGNMAHKSWQVLPT